MANNDALIALARSGDRAPAIAALKAQLLTDSRNQVLRSDLISILGWDEKWSEAVDFASQLNTNTAPIYGIKAYALAAKRAGNVQLALVLYDVAIKRSLPQVAFDMHAAKLNAMCIFEKCLQGIDEAEEFLEKYRRPEPVVTHELLFELAKAYAVNNRGIDALSVYQRILDVAPDNKAAIKEKVFLLANLRLGKLAKQEALKNPTVFSDEGQRSLTQNAVSQQIRFGEAELGVYWGEEKFIAIQQAIQEGIKLKLSNQLASDTTSQLARNSAWDRLIALRDRSQATTVIKEYEHLKELERKSDTPFNTPAYAVTAVADAYLYNQQPVKAIDLYKHALSQKLANEEINTEWQISLIYTYLDMNDFSKAKSLMYQVLNSTPQFKHKNIPGFETVNPVYTQWRVMEILVHLYADDLPKAKVLIEKFRTFGPHNLEVRNADASRLQAIGLNKLALSKYLASSVDSAYDVGSRIGLASLLLANREFKLAREQITELKQVAPFSGTVLKAAKELAVHDATEISTSINATGADLNRPNDANITNGKELRIMTDIKSPPINESFRLGGYIVDRRLTGLNRTIQDRTLGLAVHIEKPDYLVSASLNRSLLSKQELGSTLSGTWFANDHWQYTGKLELLSTETPLKALDVGVTGNVASFGVTYKSDDSSVWAANTEIWKFTDNNTRQSYSLSQRQRLNYDPIWRVHSKLLANYSTNTNSDVTYFSPKRDLLLEGEIEIAHLTWRKYEYSLRQHLRASVGSYSQYNFGIGTNWAIKYGHEWRNDPWWTLSYGVGLNQRYFNGIPEKHQFLYANGTRYF